MFKQFRLFLQFLLLAVVKGCLMQLVEKESVVVEVTLTLCIGSHKRLKLSLQGRVFTIGI